MRGQGGMKRLIRVESMACKGDGKNARLVMRFIMIMPMYTS